MKNDLDTIAKRIRYRMLVLRMNQIQLADKLSRSYSTIRNWSTGRTVPETLALNGLCRVLQCSIEWLLNGKEKTSPR